MIRVSNSGFVFVIPTVAMSLFMSCLGKRSVFSGPSDERGLRFEDEGWLAPPPPPEHFFCSLHMDQTHEGPCLVQKRGKRKTLSMRLPSVVLSGAIVDTRFGFTIAGQIKANSDPKQDFSADFFNQGLGSFAGVIVTSKQQVLKLTMHPSSSSESPDKTNTSATNNG